ncbi:glutathione S-transferase, partial [Sphingorhabdus sp.]|uniref:glutathione S-transferase n=1 Tax=Sphingorhabdus sp. TaxID=1902408 RepID=UPI0037C724E1
MTLKLIIGNKAYSSWSMRGWLACKQSGLHFEELTVPLYDESWDERKREEDLAPSSGKVPILWDGDAVIWDSMAILEYLADKVGRDRFWPKDDVARGMARAMSSEMHSGFLPLRRECSMNLRKTYENVKI